jgi:hypothetical protein
MLNFDVRMKGGCAMTIVDRQQRGIGPAPSVALAGLICVQVLFQAAPALGLPWGAAAWSGSHDGVLPAGLRLASTVAAAAWVWVVFVVLHRALGPTGRRRVLLALAIYASLGVVMNGFSSSLPERLIWTPYALATAALACLVGVARGSGPGRAGWSLTQGRTQGGHGVKRADSTGGLKLRAAQM